MNNTTNANELAHKIMNFNMKFALWSKNNYENNFNINGKSSFSLTVRQFHLLVMIHSLNECTISDIEVFLNISKSSLSLTISKLEKDGYLRKECFRGKGDGRKVYLFITEKGQKAVDESYDRLLQIFNKFYDSLSCSQQEDLQTGIEKLNNVFSIKEESFDE